MSVILSSYAFFISDSWYASAQSLIDQIREFAHYQIIFIDDHVWCTIENSKKITRKTVFFIFFEFEQRSFDFAHANLNFIDDFVWNIIESSKNEISRKISFLLLKVERILYFFWFETLRTRNICFNRRPLVERNLSFDLIIACCLSRIENDLKNHYDRDFRI